MGRRFGIELNAAPYDGGEMIHVRNFVVGVFFAVFIAGSASAQVAGPAQAQFGVTAPGIVPRQFCAKTSDGRCWPFMTQDSSTNALHFNLAPSDITSIFTNTPSTSSFWTSSTIPANFARLNDRVLVGPLSTAWDGTKNGNSPNYVWTAGGNAFAYLPRNAQFGVVASFGDIAGFFSSHTNDTALPGTTDLPISMAIALHEANDKTANPQPSWLLYGTGYRVAGAGQINGELDLLNADPVVHRMTSYGPTVTGDDQKSTIALALNSGGEGAPYNNPTNPPFPNVSASTAAIQCAGNGSTWDKCFVVKSGAISPTTDGTTVAFELPQQNIIRWVYDTSGTTGGFLNSTVNTGAVQNGLTFTNFGAFFQNYAGTAKLTQVNFVANAVNYPVLTPTVSGAANVFYGAAGADPNINVHLTPKGTGAVIADSILSAGGYISNGQGGATCGAGAFSSATATVNGGIITSCGTSTSPTLSGAGTSPSLSTGATDNYGTVTEGTTATGFVLTFSRTYANARDCVVSSPNGTAFTSYSTSTTALTLVNASGSGAKFTYQCSGS